MLPYVAYMDLMGYGNLLTWKWEMSILHLLSKEDMAKGCLADLPLEHNFAGVKGTGDNHNFRR